MASMIDVVFLLLIFFMCTSSFRALEGRLPAQLPRTGTGSQGELEDFDPIRIVLSRGAGQIQTRCDGRVCANFEVLLNHLKALRAVADVPVVIEGQTGVPFGLMVRALDTCYRADLRRVAFSAKGVDGG